VDPKQPSSGLATYLSDHRAGSAAGYRLAERLAHGDPTPGHVLHGIDAKILYDRDQLDRLMDALGIRQKPLKQAAAAVGETASRVKLRVEAWTGTSGGPLLALDALSAGVAGKRCLWQNLQRIAGEDDRIAAMPLDDLVRRADDQLRQLDAARDQLARPTLVG
jgi:hypothetical protein